LYGRNTKYSNSLPQSGAKTKKDRTFGSVNFCRPPAIHRSSAFVFAGQSTLNRSGIKHPASSNIGHLLSVIGITDREARLAIGYRKLAIREAQ
jgi:hypothetical protein